MPNIEEILNTLSELEEESFKKRYDQAFIELQKIAAENVGYNRCLNDIQERYYRELEKEKKGWMVNKGKKRWHLFIRKGGIRC